ncbi:hypothetical protein PIB30_017666 [Stylosanthes scabra]|uniref:Uncharacterized protein n=1 Tax=Stylosanthes scabra TaxID=79078 RepID=A0ABU6Y6A1_9FABA|nr:hypothetical protein [Stylosanthes scabra]
MSDSNLIVGMLYPDGETTRDADGIGFACPNPILCYIQRVETLDELKSFILCTMGAVGWKYVRWIAYRLLNILPPLKYKFKIFWVEGDVHVQAMFDLHRQYDPRQVMELLFETRDVIRSEAGPSGTWAGPMGAIVVPPLRIATPDVFDEADFVDETQVGRRFLLPAPAAIPDLASVSSHFHTLNLDAMQEEPREVHGGGGNDYLNLDGGEEFRIGHRFSCRGVVHMAVKNYNIRRALEYRVRESDQYTEIRKFGGPHSCLAPSMSADHAQLDITLICEFILSTIKSNPSVEIAVLQSAIQ